MSALTGGCSACGSPKLRYACGVCAAYTFCSQQCSDIVAEEHHRVCYNAHVERETQRVLSALGLPLDGGHEAIGAYLETRTTFPPHVLALIAASYGAANAAHIGASLAVWKSYTPLQLADKTQGFLKKFAGGPSTGAQAKIWVLKQVYRSELQSILAALDAKLSTSLAPSTAGQLEVLRQRVKGYLSQEA